MERQTTETGAQASIYGGIQSFDKREHLAKIKAARQGKKDKKVSNGCKKDKPCWRCGDLMRCTADRASKKAQRKTLLSKVCGLANRFSKGMTRKEAFTLAWSIVRSGGLELPVAGTYFRQEAIVRLFRYDPKEIIALLVPEPENRHDPEAIAVKVMVNGGKGIYTLGYVPRTDTKVARAFLGAVPELRLIDGETKGARIRLAA